MKRRRFLQSAFTAAACTSIHSNTALASALNALAQVTSDIPAVRLDGRETTLEAAALRELGDSLSGRLLLPGGADYESARKIWNGMHDRHPAVIVQCAGVEDVANAVTFAGERELLVAVRGGGHSIPGKSMCDGGLVIDLSNMKQVAVDPKRRRAVVEGGALIYDADKATLSHGLATTFGVVSHTGVGGLTLGGGFGRLNRKHGLTIDNLVSATVVTANGKVLTASKEQNPDLFWGLRGGGGNFGVATDFEFALHPIPERMLGGNVVWPASKAKEVLAFYADWAPGLSNDLYVGPFMVTPPETDGIVGLDILYAGDPAMGEKELAALAKLPEPLDGGPKMVEYMTLQTQEDGATRHGQRFYVKSGMVGTFSPELARTMIEVFRPEPEFFLFTHTSGGAVAQVAPGDTAFPHREAETMIGTFTTWTDPAQDERCIRETREQWAAIDPFTGGFYANLRPEDDRKNWDNFGPNYDRLAALKQTYDPMNLFRLNANVPPAARS
jgi:FAD/FMN-containing dehydrogenase